MTDLDVVKNALVGSSGARIRGEFALGLRGVTSWPVDALGADLDDGGYISKVYWLSGVSIGWYRMVGEGNIISTVRPVSAISQVTFIGKVDVDNFGHGTVRRTASFRFGSPAGEDDAASDINITNFSNQHFIDLNNNFIAAVMDALAHPGVAPKIRLV